VATGKSRRGLDEALQAVELRGMFDGSRTADETAGKPDPRMLHELMREFGVPPRRTLMIGDTTHDLQMALNAGCASVGVSYGAHDAPMPSMSCSRALWSIRSRICTNGCWRPRLNSEVP
jgi:phosphoglycolate phosphatase